MNYLKDEDNEDDDDESFCRGVKTYEKIKFFDGDDQLVHLNCIFFQICKLITFFPQMYLKMLLLDIHHAIKKITVYQYLFHSRTVNPVT